MRSALFYFKHGMVGLVAAVLALVGCSHHRPQIVELDSDIVAEERLQSLEPFIGTWRLTGENGDDVWRWDMTWSMAFPKTMIFGDADFHMSGPEMEAVNAPWARASMAWNPRNDTLEQTFLDLGTGYVEIFELTQIDEGEFAQTLIRSTNPAAIDQQTVIRISGTQMTISLTDRVDASGNRLPDEVQVLNRLD